jgi:hypothetical protein
LRGARGLVHLSPLELTVAVDGTNVELEKLSGRIVTDVRTMNQEERSGLELSSLSFQKIAYMKGERAKPSSTTTNVPIRISTSTIGIIQYFFRAFKNRR